MKAAPGHHRSYDRSGGRNADERSEYLAARPPGAPSTT